MISYTPSVYCCTQYNIRKRNHHGQRQFFMYVPHMRSAWSRMAFHLAICAVSLKHLFLRHPLANEMEITKAKPAPTHFTILSISHQTISKQWTRKRLCLLFTYTFSLQIAHISARIVFSLFFFSSSSVFFFIYTMSINHHGPGSATSYIPFKLYDTTTIAPSRAVGGKSTSGSVVLTVPCMHVRSCVWRRSDWFSFWWSSRDFCERTW